MKAFALIVAVLTTVTLAAGAAQRGAPPPAATGTALILGTVVDADSGKSVSGAIVTLGTPAPVAAPIGELTEGRTAPGLGPVGRRILTGSDGRFLFRDLPKGRYALSITAPGYAPASYGQGRPDGAGQPLDLDEAQKLGGVNVRAWKLAAITGTVVDERGEPAVGVQVQCLRRVIAGGQPRFSNQGTSVSTTDDRGMYRSANLLPGDYVCGSIARQATVPVSAVDLSDAASQSGNPNASEPYRMMMNSGGRSSGSGYHVGDLIVSLSPPPSARGRVMTYLTQYYPGALTTKDASVITLKSGAERSGVDLQLKLAPTAGVRGKVAGPNGAGAFLGMTLVPVTGVDIVSEGMAEAARTVSDATGAFTFLGVPTGQYVLKVRMYPQATQSAPAGPASPIVEGAPVAMVDLGLASPAGGAAGRGGPPPPPPTEPSLWATTPITVGDADVSDVSLVLRAGLKVSGRVEFNGTRAAPTADQIQRMSITLQGVEGRTSSPIPSPGRAAPDGTFRTTGYPAGRNIVAVTTVPAGWSLKSIMAGGKDVSVDPLEIVDADVNGVVITLTDQSTELSGSVTNNANAAEANADVVAFPADSQAWKEIGVVARRWRDERVTKTGTFSIAGLPPGEYFVVAVPADAPGDTRDPKYLDSLVSRATRVTLGDGDKKSVTLSVRRPGL